MLKKHQRRNKDGTIINIFDYEQGDNWTRLENELNKRERELRKEDDKETRKYCEKLILKGLKIKLEKETSSLNA